MVRSLLFGTVRQSATFAAITMAHAQPAPSHPLTGPVLPHDFTHLNS